VRLAPRADTPHIADGESLEEVVRRAFSQRRKTLRNALKGVATDADFDAAGIDPGCRAETVDADRFARLADAVAGRARAELSTARAASSDDVNDAADGLGAVVVAFLGGREQRMQHLDGRLEHLDEFHQALVGAAQGPGVAVGVGIVLGIVLQLADIHLAHQGGDVLVVLVTGLGLGDGHLLQDARVKLHHPELGDVAVVFLQALDGPGRHDGAQTPGRNAVVLFEDRAVFLRREQAERRFEHRRVLDGVEGHLLHQLLQLLGQRGLAAADGAKQVENLLALLQALSGVLEIGHELLDRVLHTEEVRKRRVALDDLVLKDAALARIVVGVYQLGLADRRKQTLRRTGIGHRIVFTQIQVL